MPGLGIHTVIIFHTVYDQHPGACFASTNFSDQTLVGLQEMGVVLIIDAEFHNDHIRIMGKQILLHPCHAKLGRSPPDPCIEISHLGAGKALTPPPVNQIGIAGFRRGGKASLGDGSP
jgi:hypothetical protein